MCVCVYLRHGTSSAHVQCRRRVYMCSHIYARRSCVAANARTRFIRVFTHSRACIALIILTSVRCLKLDASAGDPAAVRIQPSMMAVCKIRGYAIISLCEVSSVRCRTGARALAAAVNAAAEAAAAGVPKYIICLCVHVW